MVPSVVEHALVLLGRRVHVVPAHDQDVKRAGRIQRYPVAAWLNRLPPPADEIVFAPVAPLKAVVLPSGLRPA